MTIGELGRRLDRVDTSIDGLRADIQSAMAASVLLARYEPERSALLADIAELRSDVDQLDKDRTEDRRARERARLQLIVACISSVVGPIVVALVVAQLLTGGTP